MSSTNLYPFVTKKQIVARLASDAQFRLAAMVILLDRQTSHEQDTKSTLNKNGRGFMSSHAKRGTEVATKIKNGEQLTDEETSVVDTIAPRYSHQLSIHFRSQAIAADPSLAKIAGTFSADKNIDLPVVTEDVTVDPVDVEILLAASDAAEEVLAAAS